MSTLFQAFLWFLANAANSALARQLQYLKAENQILRARLPKKLTVTAQERQTLMRFGLPVGAAIKELISIVTPRTFARWVQAEQQRPRKAGSGNGGRRRTPEDVRDLVLRLARENGWGYTRILGELKKLGVGGIRRSTVVNILRENGLEPGPNRGVGTWDEFLKVHFATLWACDFFSVKAWTLGGLVEYHVLFFLQVGSRRVEVIGLTPNPDGVWMAQQARNVAMVFQEQERAPEYLLRAHDSKFTKQFDAILESEGVEVKPVGPLAPNMNAHAERFVQTIRAECLDHFVFFGERHLRHVISEFVEHYHEERPHQGVGNVPLSGAGPADPWRGEEVVCSERLGGLLKSYRKAG